MKTSIVALLSSAAVFTGCSDDNIDGPGPGDGIEITESIEADTTWTADNVYVLKENIFVRNSTLTIEAGTRVVGDPNSSLVITKTATIDAQGTASEPIVFTSSQADGAQNAGDWGGIVLLGDAEINVTGGSDSIEGFPANTEGTEYGGSNNAHNCGTLRYVRIEFAGFELSTDNELNGLTVGACGSDTTLEYIQVHKGADDGIEFFGGTADLRYAVISQPDDDGLDWDQGWTGRVQFLIVQQNAIVGNNGIEADSNKDAPDSAPRSAPTLWNITFIGSDSEPGTAGKTQRAIHFRRGTAAQVHNAIFAHFTDTAIDVDGDVSVGLAQSGALTVTNSIFLDTPWFVEMGDDDNDNGFDEEDHFMNVITGADANKTEDPVLGDALSLSAPSFAPAAQGAAFSGAATPPSLPFYNAAANFIGAVGSDDWTADWTAYP